MNAMLNKIKNSERIPAFKYPGGKARIRDKIISVFPRAGRIYFEPFVGRGNIFFAVRAARLLFSEWRINDINTASFFHAIKEIDIKDLPADVADKAAFERLKSDRTSIISRVIEPLITYCGLGYDASFTAPMGRAVYYRRESLAQRICAAKKLLKHVEITDKSWEMIDWKSLDYRDFVYLDPPYLGTCRGLSYSDINHEALLCMLKKAQFRWVISGFDSPLYRRIIGVPITFTRVSTMASRVGSKTIMRVECLWSNTWRHIK